MNKKILYLGIAATFLLIVLIIALVLISSSNKNKTQEVTLTFWNLDDNESAFTKIIEGFEQSNPNVKIEYTKKDSKDYLKNVLEAIAAGKGPDILALPNDWLPKYHSLLSPLPEGKLADKKLKKSDTDIYKNTFPNIVVQDNVIDQKIYGAPLAIDNLQLYYNPKMIETAQDEYRKNHPNFDQSIQTIFNNGPSNWDELSQLAKIVTQKSGANISRSAIALGTTENIDQSVNILTLMMLQNGAKMTADDKTAALFHTKQNQFGDIESPGTKALELYASFANSQSQNYTWNSSMPEAVRAFAEEKTAMLIGFKGQAAEIKRINPNLKYTAMNVPQVKETANPVNFASYLSYTVNRTSANSALAWDFILSAINKDNSETYFEQTQKTSARLDKIKEESPILTAISWYKPDPQKTDDIFKEMIKQVNAGQNPQTAIDEAASEITNLLGELKQ